MANTQTTTVNDFQTNHYEIIISNIPNLTSQTEDEFDMSVVNNNIKGISIPDLTVTYLETGDGNHTQYHAASMGARNMNTITLELAADDGLLNWYYFYWWAIGMRTGTIANNPVPEDADDSSIDWRKHLLRDNCITSINVYSYDNRGKVKTRLTFERCFIETISSLELKSTSSEYGRFTVTLRYEGMDLNLTNRIEDARK